MPAKLPKWDRDKFVNGLCRDAFDRGHQPPFTITYASKAGTVHTIIVLRDGTAKHSIQTLRPDQLSDALRAGLMVVDVQ